MKEVSGCLELDKLYREAWFDLTLKEGCVTCFIPKDTDEYRANPLHKIWAKKFDSHEKKCKTCLNAS